MENELMVEKTEQEEESVLLNPATHENMDNGFDMDFGLGNIAPKNNNADGFDMGLDLGLDF